MTTIFNESMRRLEAAILKLEEERAKLPWYAIKPLCKTWFDIQHARQLLRNMKGHFQGVTEVDLALASILNEDYFRTSRHDAIVSIFAEKFTTQT